MKVSTPKSWSPAIGDVVEILFLDHVEDEHEPFPFFVYGRIAKITARAITVEAWANVDRPSPPGDPNAKSFTIIKSTIERISKLTRARR